MTCVLVVDDEPIVRDVVVRYLEQAGFDTREAGDGIAAQELIEHTMPNAIVLDVMMPRMDGLEVCRRMRARSSVPIIMLTAKTEEIDKVLGLELGADDYITKPFSLREFRSRVRAALRRAGMQRQTTPEPDEQPLAVHELEIDPAKRAVKVRGETVELTFVEFEILNALARNPGRVFTRDMLLTRVWGDSAYRDPRTIDVHIRHLREKLELDAKGPEYLFTVRGVGYRFRDEER
jgi:DNA-binding response OmpR family regulator